MLSIQPPYSRKAARVQLRLSYTYLKVKDNNVYSLNVYRRWWARSQWGAAPDVLTDAQWSGDEKSEQVNTRIVYVYGVRTRTFRRTRLNGKVMGNPTSLPSFFDILRSVHTYNNNTRNFGEQLLFIPASFR
jgi:hypothetical protein